MSVQIPEAEVFARVKLAGLYPPFLAKAKQLSVACQARGAVYYAISAERTFAEQQALYDQGRKTAGQIVTKARPGTSAHNYGVAIDFCRDADAARAGLQPDWDLVDYAVLAEEAVKLGLEAAYNWASFKEGPHIQLPLGSKGLTFDKLISIYTKGGKAAVFAELDKHVW